MALTKVKLIADGTIVQSNLHASHGITTADIGENASYLYYTDGRVSSYLSSNGYATQTDIVAAITDSAPATLDTLNELAAALGDDANFSTTVTNSIALKAPLASPSFTGNATFAGEVNATRFILPSTGTTTPATQYLFTNNTNTATGKLIIQSGGGSAGFGGAINLFSHSHSTKPGWVIAGISSGSGGKFSVNTQGTAGGTDVFTVDTSGNATFTGNVVIDGTTNSGRLFVEQSGADMIDMTRTSVGTYRLAISTSDKFSIYDVGAASDRLVIDSSGNVGIGTTSPGTRLDVRNDDGVGNGLHLIGDFSRAGGADAELILGYFANGSAVTGPVVYAANSYPLLFSSGSLERMRITSGGFVGIGEPSPVDKLHVSGGNVRIYSTNNANHLILKNNATGTSGTFEERIKFLGWNDTENAAIIGIGNAYFGSPVNALAFQVTGAEAMRIKHGGNVGIGTATPQAQLHINEDTSNSYATLRLEGANRGGIIDMYNQTSYPVSRILTDQSGNIFISTSGAFASTSLSEKFTILTGGNVGIGITSPTRKLHIVNTDDTRGILVENTLATSYAELHLKASREFRVGTGGVSSATDARDRFYIYDGTAAAHRFTIDSSGNVGIGNGNPLAKLQITSGDSGASSAWSNADELILESSGNVGLAFQTPNTGAATIAFQDPESVQAGFIQYLHGDNALRFATNGNFERMRIDSSGNLIIKNTSGSQVFKVANDGELAITNGATYSTTYTYSNAWNAGYQTIIPGSQLSPNSVYIVTIETDSFGTPPYYATAVFHVATSPGTNGNGGGNDNIAPTATHVNSNVHWKYRLSTIASGRNGVEAYLVNGPSNLSNNPTIRVRATKIMTW
jgi:hypothetical protein